VELVNGERAANEAGTKQGGVDGNELPHSRVVVGKHLELCVKVEVQEDEASEGSGGVTRRHRLETVVNLLLVTRADAAVEHDLAVSIGNVTAGNTSTLVAVVWSISIEEVRNNRLAHGEEVRAQTTNEPLDKDLEDGSRDERVQQADGSVVDIPKASGADLDDQEDCEGNEEGHESSSPDGNDLSRVSTYLVCTSKATYLIAQRVRKLWVHNLAVPKGDGEAATRRRIRHVDTKTDSTHNRHGNDVESSSLDPLTKGRPAVPRR
jgi:hypothetical protein